MGLSVDSDIPAATELFDKTAGDLQTGIEVGENSITGTLKAVTGYQAYTGDEQDGHFLALHCDVPGETGITFTVELIGGLHGPVTLDPDGLVVLRIANTSQKVKVTASKAGYAPFTRVFSLTGLTLA